MKSSNDLVAKLFETIESKVKKTGDDSTDLDSSDSDDDSSISLSLSSSSDEKSKSKSSKKSKKSKKKKKKKTSSKKKKRKHSSDSSSDSGDEKVKKSKKKKKKHSKDKHKDKDDKEALHKKLKLNDKMSSLDDIFTNKRKSSIDDNGVASKKAKLDKSSERNKNSLDLGVNEAILGAIEKEMSENASQTISEILDDLLGSDKSRINEKKLLEDSLLNVKIKKEKEDDFTKAINIKKEKVDKLNESTSEKSQEKSERKEEKESEISQNNHHSDKEDEGKTGMSEGIEGEKKSDGDNKKGDKSDGEKTDEEIPLPPVADVFVEDLLASKAATEIVKANTDKIKPPTGKITIGNLKQPTVFKEIEDAEKQRRSKYEDGEITPSEGEDDKSESDKHRKEKRKKSSSSKSRRGSDRTSRHRKHRSRDTSRSRSRDRSSKSYHHSATSSSRLRHRRGRSSRSRSVSRDRTRDRERDRDGRRSSRLKSRRSSRSISLSLSPPGRRKSKSPIDSAAKIDKRKLLEIARKNAVNMMKEGVITGDKRKLISWKAGGSTVNELTDFCKLLAKQEGEESAEEKSSDSESSHASEGEPVFHHPFEIKQRPDHIVMNIKNAMALKTRTFQEKTTEQSKTLSLQFPVSSGTQHRRTESEWVPVTTSVPSIMPAPTPTTTTAQPSTPGSNIRAPPAPMELNFSAVALPGAPPLSTQLPLAPAPAAAPVQAPLAIEPAPAGPQPAVFTEPDPDVMNMDIGAVVSQRLKAMRRLAENPHDSEAQIQMYHAQKKMKAWAESKQMPGQFTGSTEVRILTPQELAAGSQAWARKMAPSPPPPPAVPLVSMAFCQPIC
ncbi:hypothetical protein M8J77_006255 [Diaphorina citri]|nr:hypothetical protein M8J77_006255 [Diaphorina citri]